MAREFGDHLGIDHLMTAGEKISDFLPPHIDQDFDKLLEQLAKGNFKTRMRLDIPSKISKVPIRCYHIPNFGKDETLLTIKLVGSFAV